MIKALIFDFDGTIIDTETAWYAAFREAYQQYEVELTLEMYSRCIGTSLHVFNPYEYLMTDLGLPIDKESFASAVRVRHAELMSREQVRPGVADYLEQARERGLKIGLATSSKRDWIDEHMERLGIGHYFECISTADDVARVKPDPELYLRTLAGLGVEAHEAVALEDSPNGAKAAVAAGIPCVLAPNEITWTLAFPSEGILCRVNRLSELAFETLVTEASGV
ncbi:HAD family hydrolase [Cohnella lubricantis]|uniref:HAD family hydrolase n=1 Tax=Cohnella lubricantis TaxID=2163172 RepID=A0A841TBF0_9BACL|nr:HAD family hydrolase [Cohnella lubricantis]MBB6678624.1 HAD family hydrolase [Cohnella lubricantis]MBP2119216.1 putative hydrolase of the HAD superfamily [Cohnella lubricantis]